MNTGSGFDRVLNWLCTYGFSAGAAKMRLRCIVMIDRGRVKMERLNDEKR